MLHQEIVQSKAILRLVRCLLFFRVRLRIEQIFQNLISNALKYRNPDINPVIEIEANETLTHWIFR
jgi:signal transduction histidine kinase